MLAVHRYKPNIARLATGRPKIDMHIITQMYRGYIDRKYKNSVKKSEVLDIILSLDAALDDLNKETEEAILNEKD